MPGSNVSQNRDCNVVNVNLLAAKLTDLNYRVRRVESRCPATVSALAADQDALDLIAFNLMIAVQLCADIASHIISDQGWPAARTLGDGFDKLNENGVIRTETAVSMSRAAGFRNVVAHGYAGIDVDIVFQAANAGLGDLRTFAQEVSQWIQENPPVTRVSTPDRE